jgi:hypothetical protein
VSSQLRVWTVTPVYVICYRGHSILFVMIMFFSFDYSLFIGVVVINDPVLSALFVGI